jgi:carbon monoxide dehydrogenase subunit G
MLIENSFDVDADPDRVFRFLQNPHNVATCFPGAELTEDLGDDQYRGKVKIKLGPVTAAFSGVAKITEKDDVARIAVLVAEGKDARGSGTAKATATMRVEPTETGSNVLLKTDLTISGKLAQFGRGIMADVSGRMVNDLAVRVRERIESEPEATEAAATEAAAEPAEAASAETPVAGNGKPEAVAEAPAETAAAAESEPETPAASDSKSKTVAEAPAEAPAETATASGSTSEAAAGADSGVVSGATTKTATAAATAKPAAKATPAASTEPAGAIKATTLLKVMVTGMFRRLFARLRGRSHSA